MPVFFIVVGVVTLGLIVAAVIGTLDTEPAPDPVRPFGHQPLPEGSFDAADVDDVRFDAVLRGYRMSEVDGVLDRMQRRQAELEEQVRALGGDPAVSAGPAHETAAAVAHEGSAAVPAEPVTTGEAPELVATETETPEPVAAETETPEPVAAETETPEPSTTGTETIEPVAGDGQDAPVAEQAGAPAGDARPRSRFPFRRTR